MAPYLPATCQQPRGSSPVDATVLGREPWGRSEEMLDRGLLISGGMELGRCGAGALGPAESFLFC